MKKSRNPYNMTRKRKAEAHGRMLGRLFALEIIGFAVIIAIELLK